MSSVNIEIQISLYRIHKHCDWLYTNFYPLNVYEHIVFIPKGFTSSG